MRQVLVPTDDLESTTQGKYNKGDWMVFITFQKCLQVSILLKLMEFFYLYSELIFAERPFFEKEAKFGQILIWHLHVLDFCNFHIERTP